MKIISVGGRSLQTNCLKVKNIRATGTGGPSYEETSQKPFMSLPTELCQEEEPQKNDAVKLAEPQAKKGVVKTPLGPRAGSSFPRKE